MKEEDRYYEGPNSFDAFYGFAPMGYRLIKGMLPSNVPSLNASAFKEPNKQGEEDEVSSTIPT